MHAFAAQLITLKLDKCLHLHYSSHRSASALDEVVLRRQASVYDVPRRSWLSSLTMDPSSPVYGNNLYEEIMPYKPRFATVSPKNFRFFISQEKSRAIEKSFDS